VARAAVHTSLVLLVALISGCGNGGQSSTESGQPGVADPTAATQPSAVDGNGCSLAQRAGQTGSAKRDQNGVGASGESGGAADSSNMPTETERSAATTP